METDDLHYFLDLARSLNFHQSAQDCYLSPSTLSRRVMRLEEELGVSLFKRHSRQVELTEAGVRFRRYAQESLLKLGELRADLALGQRVLKGSLSLYCSATSGYSMLPDLLRRYRSRFPLVQIDLEIGTNHLAPEKARSKDLVVVALPHDSPLEKLALAHTPLVLVGPPGAEPSAWEQMELVVAKGGTTGLLTRIWLAQLPQRPAKLHPVGGNEAVLTLVALGLGWGLVPRLVWEHSPLAEQLQLFPCQPPLPELTVYLARQGNNQSPTAQAFWAMVSSLETRLARVKSQ